MYRIRTGLGFGLLGGAIGLAMMEIVRRATAPLVSERAHKPTDVFMSERTMSPLGPKHEPDESSTAAVARLGYDKLVGRAPSARTKSALSWLVHITCGLLVASAYGAIRGRHPDRAVRDGIVFGSGLWLLGDELAVPLLGLADKPTAYHPTQHLQSLARHLAFGVSTAATLRALEESR